MAVNRKSKRDRTLGNADAIPGTAFAEAVTADERQTYTVRNAMEIAEMELPGLEYAVAGIPLEGGNVAEVIGPPGIGKSRLMLWLAICQVIGKPFPDESWAGRKDPLTWLFFGTENSLRRWNSDLRVIVKSLTADERELLRRFIYLPTLEHPDDAYMILDDAANVEKCIQTMRIVNPDVIVFDPWGDLCADELKDEVQRDTVRQVRKIARSGRNPNVPVILLNHSRMGAKVYESAWTDPGNYGRNSKAIYGQCREVFNIRPAYTDPDSFGKSLEILDVKHNDRRGFRPVAVYLDEETLTYKQIIGYDHKAAQDDWARATRARKADDGNGEDMSLEILPYVLAELDTRREEARKSGGDFRGVNLGTLRAYVMRRMTADGKKALGYHLVDDLIKGLPADKIKLTKKTANGILVGTIEDMRWYQG